MINEKKLLFNYLSYILLGFIICLVGISNVFADEVIDTSTWLDRTGRGWSDNVLDYSSNKVYNDYWFKNNYDLVGGVYTPPNTFDYVTLQYFEHDGLYNPCNNDSYKLDFRLHYSNSNFLQYIKSFYINETACTITGTDTINGNVSVSCVYTPVNSNKVTLAVNYKDFSSNSTSEVYISRNINTTCSLSSGAIIQNQNENTQNIINNNNSNTESINSNNDTNTQNIINNNNSNTQSINNNINSNFQDCRDSNNLFDVSTATSKNYNSSLALENTNYYVYHPNQDNITITATGIHYMEPVYLQPGTYNFNYKVTSTGANFKRYRFQIMYGPKGSASNLTTIASGTDGWDTLDGVYGKSVNFTLSSATYVWISITNDVSGGTLTIYDYMLSKGSTKQNYEKYGVPVCKNKLTGIYESISDLQNNQNSNTQDIIDNQNSNTQDIIDNQKVCTYSSKSFYYYDYTSGSYLTDTGEISSDSTSAISDYFKILPDTDYEIKNTATAMNVSSYCLYDENKNLISCERYNRRTSVNFNSGNAVYFRTSLSRTASNPTIISGTLCLNGNQALNDNINNLTNSIMDNSNPDVPSVETMVGWLPPGPVDSILNLPLSFLNTLNTNLGKTCSPVTVPIPFVNQTFQLPCFSEYMSDYLPSFNTLWSLIGGIVCVYILYNYLLSLYVWVDKTLTLRENTMPGYYDDNWGGGA